MDIQELTDKLHKEGIEKGKEEANKIIEDAKKEGEKIIKDAEAKKEEIISAAKEEAEKILESGKNNLKLAAGEAILKLESDISKIIQEILEKKLDGVLEEKEILKGILEIIAKKYVEEDDSHGLTIELSEDLEGKLKDWLVNELKAEVSKNKSISCLQIVEKDGGKVEISSEAVKEVILPYLNKITKKLVEQEKS